MIRIIFFAQLRESLGIGEIQWPLDQHEKLESLILALQSQSESWCKALSNQNLLMSINKEFAKPDSIIKPGDEVAFFPPVTGG
jgi:sulfur-carrier protein